MKHPQKPVNERKADLRIQQNKDKQEEYTNKLK